MPETADIALYTAAQVRELDRTAIEVHGIPGYELMCRAGAALARQVETGWPGAGAVLILCGPGNNGGDGYVLGRLLVQAGRAVQVLALTDPERLRGDARRAADDFRAAGGCIARFAGELPAESCLLVDALLGTGLDRAVEGEYRIAIEALNRHPAPILAVDIPSGLHADGGRELGVAVVAHTTVTFIGRKRGLYTGRGPACAGRVVFDDLAVPAATYSACESQVRLLGRALPEPSLRPRAADAHKGDFGHVLVVGGAPGMPGAARLAAEAAARSGAGLVSVATHAVHAAALNNGRPELMVRAVDAPAQLADLLVRATIVAVGPGLGRGPWGRALFERVLETGLPLVVDADALNLLAADPLKRDDWVLTPHPGEAARLLQSTSAAVQADRFAAVTELQARYGGVAVLKGAGTLVAGGGAPLHLCALGNPGMASGGMGDVLTGVIAGLRAQGLSPLDAACSGVCLHAGAADALAAIQGERGLLAGDLIPEIRRLLNERR